MDIPGELTFLGEAYMYLFQADEDLYSVYLKLDGKVLVTREPNEKYWEFVVWGEFHREFPEFADHIKKRCIEVMQDNITKISKLQAEKAVESITDRMYC